MSFPVTITQYSSGGAGITVTVYSGVPGRDGVGIPAGGTTGQSLTKVSDTDFDTAWATVGGGGGGGSGTVTSVGITVPGLFAVAGSPITTAGTIVLTLAAQAAKTFLAGPASGANAAPTMRAIAATDLPANVAFLDASQTWTAKQTFSSGVVSNNYSSTGIIVFSSAAQGQGIFFSTGSSGGMEFLSTNSTATLSARPAVADTAGVAFVVQAGTPISVSSPNLAGGDVILAGGMATGSGTVGRVLVKSADLATVLVTFSAAGDVAASTFTGSGANITNLNAANLASGTLPDARLSANVPLLTAGKLSSSVLPTSGVTAGSYTLASITVDAAGRVTAASSGSAGGTGTVTSVALTAPAIFAVSGSPVTGAGTLALSLATQAANKVFAGPATGADAAPTFRALALADLPTLTASDVGAQPADAELTALAGLTSAADQLPYFTGSGTAALTTLSGASRTLLAATDATGARTALGLGTLATKSTVTLTTDVTGVLPAGNLPTTVVYGDAADIPHRVGWVLARGTPATVGTNKAGVKVRLPYAGAFKKVWIDAETGPTGAALILDIKLNGTSLWATTPANRPAIAAGSTSGTQTAFDTTTFAAGDYLTIDVAQVGSTIAGQDIAVALDTLEKNQ